MPWYPPVVLHEGEDVEIYYWPDGEPTICDHGVPFSEVCGRCEREREHEDQARNRGPPQRQ